MKTTQITKKHAMQLQLKLDNLNEAMSTHLHIIYYIKNYSKSCYAYVRSKPNVHGWTTRRQCYNIISQGFLMAEDLNGYLSSVFTREDISSLPVPDANVQTNSDYLGQLIITPEEGN